MKIKFWKFIVFIFIMIFALSAANAVYAVGVTATITVGGAPWGVAYDSGKGEIFVANSSSNSVLVISDSNNAVLTTVTVGQSPYRVIYDSGKGEIFVANYGANSVSVISDSTNAVVATVSVGEHPLGVAYDSAKGEIFVVNSGSGTVSVISDSTNAVIATVTVGTNPGPIAYDFGKGEIFAVNRDSDSVSVISDSTNAVVATVTVGTKPYGAAYDSGMGEVFVANYGSGTVSVISDSSDTSASPTPTAKPTSSPTQTAVPTSTPNLLQQVWVPQPANAVAAIGVSVVAIGVVSLVFASISNPLGGLGGTVAEKTKDLIPDKIKQWLEEIVSSRRKLNVTEKTGSLFRPTKPEALAYITSIIVLAIAFAYVKVITLSQIWALLPVFFATSVLVGFVQKFFSIAFMRSRGVWSEHKIWPFGLILFLFTTFAFKVPFSSPTRSVHQSTKFTERLGAIASTSEILINLAFAGFFFLLLMGGYTAIGGAGLAMCVIGSLCGTFPVSPMSGKEIFNHSKRLWAGLFITTVIIFAAWLLLI